MSIRIWGLWLASVALGGGAGCTAESVRLALEAQQRADEVQQAVFERQNEALRLLLYRDLVSRLDQNGPGLSEKQRALLSEAWNDRDLLEFWAVQQERAYALRLAGVNTRLASEQAVIELLIRNAQARLRRAGQEVAEEVIEQGIGSAGR
jgi:hypothetical protein